MVVFVVFFSNSFGYFRKRIEGTKLTFNVGTLSYELDCIDLENCEIVIPANNSEVFNINLTSLNSIETKYGLYYEIVSPSDTKNILSGGHFAIENVTQSYLIGSNETRNISLIINNTGNDEVTIKLGVKPSLKNNEAELEENQISLNNEMYQKYYVYDYIGSYDTFVAPVAGYYALEAWGAQGGASILGGGASDTSSYEYCISTTSGYCNGGNGAYTFGTIYLAEKEKIQVVVGEKGNDGLVNAISSGGYNGGGNSDYDHNDNEANGAGGGATDFRYSSTLETSLTSLNDRIMVAAGGGGGSDVFSGLPGGTLTSINTNILGYIRSDISLATQMTGYSFGKGEDGVTIRTNYPISGAGGGYYGGYATDNGVSYENISSGGSSYISGYTGSIAITSSTDTTPKTGCSEGTTDVECSYHYSNKIFKNPIMISGNGQMPTHDLTSTMFGNTGNGYARITYLGNDTYTIKYNANGGVGAMEDANVLESERYTLDKNTFIKEGYKFVGWSLSPDSDEVIYNDLAIVADLAKKDEIINLYAVWTEKVVITFDAAEGSVDTVTKEVAIGHTYGDLPIPTRVGYTFTGWYTQSSGGTLITSDSIISVTGDQILYAQWSINKVYIKYNVNGGKVTASTISSTTTYAWTQDSSGQVYYSSNGGTSNELLTELNYGTSTSSSGLNNYNNSTYLNIKKTGYSGVSGAEWICLSGNCKVGTTYDHATVYKASDFCDASNGDCTAVIGVNWRINKVYVKYNVNGGTVTASTSSDTTTYAWTQDSSGQVYYSFNGGTSNELLTELNYGASTSSSGLNNYNNSTYLNIKKTGYSGVSGAEWICLSGNCKVGTTYDHKTVYKASDFCDASNGDCTAVIGVNWRINKVYVKYNVNGGTVTASTSSDTTTYAWTQDSSGYIYRSTNGGTSKQFITELNYGASTSSSGLNNYNNSSSLNIKKTGYSGVSGAEWICLSGNCKVGTTYNHATVYKASDFCDASNGDCTAVIGVNWKANSTNLISNMTSNNWSITSQNYGGSFSFTQNSSISMSATNNPWSDVGVKSTSFDITDFSKITISLSNYSPLGYNYIKLVTNSGKIDLTNGGTYDISSYTGSAYLSIYVCNGYSGSKFYTASLTITNITLS